MIEELRQALAERTVQRIDDARRVPSAVLLPLFNRDGEDWILFTKRTETVRHHKGQISFPGGRYDDSDESLLATALRESREEIGLESEDVDLLGELDDMRTYMTNYVITPFVGFIPSPYSFTIHDAEVAEIIELPVADLLDESCIRPENDPLNDGFLMGSFYYCRKRIIWGASARILGQFLEVYRAALEK